MASGARSYTHSSDRVAAADTSVDEGRAESLFCCPLSRHQSRRRSRSQKRERLRQSLEHARQADHQYRPHSTLLRTEAKSRRTVALDAYTRRYIHTRQIGIDGGENKI